jgi:hypothetical protein
MLMETAIYGSQMEPVKFVIRAIWLKMEAVRLSDLLIIIYSKYQILFG